LRVCCTAGGRLRLMAKRSSLDGVVRSSEVSRRSYQGCIRYVRARSKSALLRSLEGVADLPARKHGRIHHLELVGADAGDSALLIGADLIREGAGVDFERDDLAAFVDGVGAIVGDRSVDYALGLLWRRRRGIVGGDLRQVRTAEQDVDATVGVEYLNAFRIGA